MFITSTKLTIKIDSEKENVERWRYIRTFFKKGKFKKDQNQ